LTTSPGVPTATICRQRQEGGEKEKKGERKGKTFKKKIISQRDVKRDGRRSNRRFLKCARRALLTVILKPFAHACVLGSGVRMAVGHTTRSAACAEHCIHTFMGMKGQMKKKKRCWIASYSSF
jgi:hypothetical protein